MTRSATTGLRRPLQPLLALLLCLQGVTASAAPVEYQIKAVFLYNFSQFISWPEQAFASKHSPFNVCILGQDPFGILLDVTLEGQESHGRPIAPRRLRDLSEAGSCRILYLGPDVAADPQPVLHWSRRRPVLLISDQPGFAAAGGAVELRKDQGRIRLLINRAALTQNGLEAQANLLRLADILDGEP